MKQLHTISLAISLVITLTTTAQVNKRAILLGGNLNFGSAKTTNNISSAGQTSTVFNFSPVFGIAVKENLVTGIGAYFGLSKSEQKNIPLPQSTNYNTYGGYFFIRKYKAIGKNGFSIFAQGNIGVDHNKGESKTPLIGYNQDIKRTNYSVSAAPGISFAISKKLQLETGFNNAITLYVTNEKVSSYNNNVLTSTEKINSFGISTNLNSFTSSFYLGFRVLLNRS
jgi:hypothetical protein